MSEQPKDTGVKKLGEGWPKEGWLHYDNPRTCVNLVRTLTFDVEVSVVIDPRVYERIQAVASSLGVDIQKVLDGEAFPEPWRRPMTEEDDDQPDFLLDVYRLSLDEYVDRAARLPALDALGWWVEDIEEFANSKLDRGEAFNAETERLAGESDDGDPPEGGGQ